MLEQGDTKHLGDLNTEFVLLIYVGQGFLWYIPIAVWYIPIAVGAHSSTVLLSHSSTVYLPGMYVMSLSVFTASVYLPGMYVNRTSLDTGFVLLNLSETTLPRKDDTNISHGVAGRSILHIP